MVFYFDRRFQSASVGARLIAVVCDKCGCEYFYELARIGSSSRSAPYAIGSKGAAQAAAEQAQRDLGNRLEREAELVPCPKCHWINEGLVTGYRRSRYRRWASAAAGIGFFGTIASLFGAWFVSIGPAADRGALPFLLVLGPAISITLATLILLARNWLRNRIKPNRHYPLPPTLPQGCPAPLMMDLVSGQLEAATQRRTPGDLAGEWIEFQVGRHELPSLCCECLLPPTPKSAYRHPAFPAVELVIPLCSGCAREWQRRKWLVGSVTFGLTIALALLVLIALSLDEVVFWVLFGGLCFFALYVGAAVAYGLTTPVRVKAVDASRGIVRLRFRSDEYRKRLALNDGVAT